MLKMKIYKTIKFSVVLYVYETWYLTFREEWRLKVFENRILRRIFGPTEMRFRSVEVSTTRNFIVRAIKCIRLIWAGHVLRMEEDRSAFKILLGWPTGKSLLGRPWRTWEDNIKTVLKETGMKTRNWVDLARDRDYWWGTVNAALNLVSLHRSMY